MQTTLIIAIFLVIFIILGFNIFAYIQKVSNVVVADTSSIVKQSVGVVKTVGETAVGAVEGGVEGTIKGAIEGGRKGLDLKQSPDELIQNARNSIYFSSYLPHRNELKGISEAKRENEIGKDGYCLIGQEGMDGIPRRACVRVGVNDRCLSNKIYPTMEVCINPSLRA